ncbi:MAG TPA: SLC13/DASS family transporter [Firmicutes bacterium]|nr:SLC13/DASS family transporter [Bacillota bacterium]
MQQSIVFATLGVTLFLFIWGKIRHDLVALIALFILTLTGLIDPLEAFSGFGHPAVITVAAVLIIGKALEQSGLVDLLGNMVMNIGKSFFLQVIVLCFLVGVLSAFMNNVASLAIMMPIAILLAKKAGKSPSYILMPISFSSLLGGMTTLIGTPPNIIVSAFRAEELGRPFGMFDFSPVGGVIALAGIIFISLIGWRFLPKRTSSQSSENLFRVDNYITEVKVFSRSKLKGVAVNEISSVTDAKVHLESIIRKEKTLRAPDTKELFKSGDIVKLRVDAHDLAAFIDDTGVRPEGYRKIRKDAKKADYLATMEVVVMPGSSLIGHSAADLKLRSRYGFSLLALARPGGHVRTRLMTTRFKKGDVLLLQGREESLMNAIKTISCLPLAQRGLRIGYQKKIPLALGIFALSVLSVVTGLLPVQMAFPIAAVLMILAKVLPVEEMYSGIDWPIIILLGAMIPVGTALETSGGSETIASSLLHLQGALPAWALLGILLVVTMFLSDIINNAATVVLMAPIAVSVARGLGFSPDPFLMAVAIGGSSAFLSPIGHQSNTLVMGPGGYRFTDYARMGLPLEIIIVIISLLLLPLFWPL